MRSVFWRFRAFLVLSTLACSGGDSDSATEPSASPDGTYTLRTVNGSSLPFTVSQTGNDSERVTGGNFVLGPGSAFSNTTTVQTTRSGQVTSAANTCTGTYTRNFDNFQFSETSSTDCGDSYGGSLVGTSLTVRYSPTIIAVYTK